MNSDGRDIMTINLASLDWNLFHKLGNDLVKKEYPKAICLEGKGGDDGIDCYDGDLKGDNLHVFQHKFLPDTLKDNGKQQIIDSLTQLLEKHTNVRKWTLLLPKDLTLPETNWFREKIIDKHPDLEIEKWEKTHLLSLLNKYPAIRYDYFQLPDVITNQLNSHFQDLKTRVIDPLLGIINIAPLTIPTIESLTETNGVDLSLQPIIHTIFDENSITVSNDQPSIHKQLSLDLIKNHYPEIGLEWKKASKSIRIFNAKEIEIKENIGSLMKKSLNSKKIKFSEKESSDFNNIVPVIKFLERFSFRILNNKYLDSDFIIDPGDPQRVRIVYTDENNSLIYQCNPEDENAQEIVNKIQNSCKSIKNKMKNDLDEYRSLKSNCMKDIASFKDILSKIKFYVRLNIMDDGNDNIKCEYIHQK